MSFEEPKAPIVRIKKKKVKKKTKEKEIVHLPVSFAQMSPFSLGMVDVTVLKCWFR